jgi:hypothetical protein
MRINTAHLFTVYASTTCYVQHTLSDTINTGCVRYTAEYV